MILYCAFPHAKLGHFYPQKVTSRKNLNETCKEEQTEIEPKHTCADDPVGSVRLIRGNPSES